MRRPLFIQLAVAAVVVTIGIVLTQTLNTWLGLLAFLALLGLGYAVTAPTRSR